MCLYLLWLISRLIMPLAAGNFTEFPYAPPYCMAGFISALFFADVSPHPSPLPGGEGVMFCKPATSSITQTGNMGYTSIVRARMTSPEIGIMPSPLPLGEDLGEGLIGKHVMSSTRFASAWKESVLKVYLDFSSYCGVLSVFEKQIFEVFGRVIVSGIVVFATGKINLSHFFS
jgi:hypothetical protein